VVEEILLGERGKFVFGVGAQKAGTTWLHQYISSHDFSDFGFRKEYHVFDAAEDKKGSFYIKAKRRAEVASRSVPVSERGMRIIQRYSFIEDFQKYFDFFMNLLNQDGICLTGDMTPNYAHLREEVYSSIDWEFSTRGVSVLPVFVMRDPVYRLQSQVRMSFRNSGLTPIKSHEISRMSKFMNRNNFLKDSYPYTLERIFKVFGRERVFVDLYEHMFTSGFRDRLSNFLEVNLSAPPVHSFTNVSKTGNDLTESEYWEFREMMKDTYSRVGELTGMDVNKFWRFG